VNDVAPVYSSLRIVQRLSFCRDAGEVTSILASTARELTGADGITVVFKEGDLCYYAEENASAQLWKGRRFPMQACISGWCMEHHRQVVIADIYADTRVAQDVYKPTFVKSLAMVPIRTEDPIGAVGAYWATAHEATAAELEILQALADCASMALANVKLIGELKEGMRRKDKFLSMLAHELRSPLPPIMNALHVLRLRGAGSTTINKAEEMIDRQVRHLSRIVDDLVDVARINNGNIPIRTERLDLARVVRQSVDDRRSMFNAAGLALNIIVPNVPLWVTGDAMRLEQVIANLLDNAVKFTPADGSVTVELVMDDATGEAITTIRDTGIGIEPDMLERVFDVFDQADRSLDRAHGGLGLGLSVARGLAELHRGSLRAASEGLGKGAEFVMRLPCLSEMPALVDAAAVPRPAEHRERILVIEDNRDSADSLKLLLETCGFDVTVAYTGWQGLAAARAVQPSIVLCDIGLPGMDGFSLASALRQHPSTARARLIAVTGYGRDEDRNRALLSGFDVHLVKPVEPDSLLEQILTQQPA